MAKNISPDVSNNEKILVDLTNGTRKPANAQEKELLAEIEEIKKKGRIVEIPSEIF